MKRRLSAVASLFIGCLCLSGCAASIPPAKLNDPNNSLVLGYIDMEDAQTPADSATLAQADPSGSRSSSDPGSDPGSWKAAVNDGLFMFAVPPGSYELTNISGSKFLEGESQYKFPRQNGVAGLRIGKPGVYFLGSFKVRRVKSRYFPDKRYMVDKVGKPREADLLRRLLEDRDISNSALGGKIRARLARLK